MRIAIAALLCCLAAPAHAETRNYTVSSFDQVRIEGAVDVIVETDVAPYASAEGPASKVRGIDVRLNGRTLTVSMRRETWGAFTGDSNQPVVVRVGTPVLDKATVNGSGRLTISAVENDEFSLTLGGSGHADISQLETDRLTVRMAGAGSMRLSGHAKTGAILVRGLSALQAGGLTVRDLNLAVEGNSLVQVTVNNSVDIEAAGSGDITLLGRPACTLDLRGPARVTGCEVREGFGR